MTTHPSRHDPTDPSTYAPHVPPTVARLYAEAAQAQHATRSDTRGGSARLHTLSTAVAWTSVDPTDADAVAHEHARIRRALARGVVMPYPEPRGLFLGVVSIYDPSTATDYIAHVNVTAIDLATARVEAIAQAYDAVNNWGWPQTRVRDLDYTRVTLTRVGHSVDWQLIRLGALYERVTLWLDAARFAGFPLADESMRAQLWATAHLIGRTITDLARDTQPDLRWRALNVSGSFIRGRNHIRMIHGLDPVTTW